MQAPLLHSIEEVAYMKDAHSLVLVQPFSRTGSLKDLIHQVRGGLILRASLSAIPMVSLDQSHLSLAEEICLKSHS